MAAILRRVRRGWRCESGAELVEFALAFPLLLFVVLGIMDFGMMFQQYEVLTNAAREGARVAVLPGYNPATDAPARVQQYLAASFLSGGGAWTIQAPTSANVVINGSCMTVITVTVTYPHQFIFLGGIGRYFNSNFGIKTLTASSAMRAEVAATPCP
jgi:Flp pilus assembly protein TadG